VAAFDVLIVGSGIAGAGAAYELSDGARVLLPEREDAVCIERMEAAADIPARRIVRSWAGLRSFVADRSPVIAFDDGVPGFFWLAGQGGYGVQTAPAAARTAAALARGEPLPADIAAYGVTVASLAPPRLR
jgi:D-arginine dehydrogenase